MTGAGEGRYVSGAGYKELSRRAKAGAGRGLRGGVREMEKTSSARGGMRDQGRGAGSGAGLEKWSRRAKAGAGAGPGRGARSGQGSDSRGGVRGVK